MSNQNQILIVGLPSTGKTTFIAALWHILEFAEIDSRFELVLYEGDKEYLNTIRDNWLEYERVGRSIGKKISNIYIKEKNGSKEFKLVIPDISGEIFEQLWVERSWNHDYDELAKNTNSILLFLHPDVLNDAYEIEENLEFDIDIPQNDEMKEWNPSEASTQSVLVDLLQMLIQKIEKDVVNVGIIISAWDKIGNKYFTPNSWVKKSMPLLTQYLKTNQDKIRHKIMGVSAQGCDYDNEEDVMNVMNLDKHTERIKLFINDKETSDLSICVDWFEETNV